MSELQAGIRTPVLLVNYRRPDLTRGLINRLRKTAPSVVYFFADGPKAPEDAYAVDQVRECVNEIDWSCDLSTLFPDVNLGCKDGVIGAIDWVLQREDRVIVLEDDCFPSSDFLPFCELMLEMYKSDEEIAMVSGTNDISKELISHPGCPDFLFDVFGSTWGWATWKRSWEGLDRDASRLSNPENITLLDPVSNRYAALTSPILSGLKSVAEGALDTWDFQWAVSRLLAGQLTIVPRQNLIVNRGFGPHATHTKSRAWGIPRRTRSFPVDSLQRRPVSNDKWFTDKLEARATRADVVRKRVRNRKAVLKILTNRIVKPLLIRARRHPLRRVLKGTSE